jgi:hypothetical protein
MSAFRRFVRDKWEEHKEELLEWDKQLPQYDQQYYFRKHRWFLKNIFKKQVDNSEQ